MDLLRDLDPFICTALLQQWLQLPHTLSVAVLVTRLFLLEGGSKHYFNSHHQAEFCVKFTCHFKIFLVRPI